MSSNILNSDPTKASRPWDVVSICKFKNTNYSLLTKLLIYYMLMIHLSVILVRCNVFLFCWMFGSNTILIFLDILLFLRRHGRGRRGRQYARIQHTPVRHGLPRVAECEQLLLPRRVINIFTFVWSLSLLFCYFVCHDTYLPEHLEVVFLTSRYGRTLGTFGHLWA